MHQSRTVRNVRLAVKNLQKEVLEVKPDLVVDDRDSCIKEAIELGITTLKVD